MNHPINILFLCTGNSARSILAEALLNHKARGQMRGYSAGSDPAGTPNPHALALLQDHGIDTAGLSSKSWDAFAAPDAAKMDLVITVCDAAANEPCPYWPGAPLSAHWGLPDPAAIKGNSAAIQAGFADAFAILERRIDALLALESDAWNADTLNRIGAMGAKPEG